MDAHLLNDDSYVSFLGEKKTFLGRFLPGDSGAWTNTILMWTHLISNLKYLLYLNRNALFEEVFLSCWFVKGWRVGCGGWGVAWLNIQTGKRLVVLSATCWCCNKKKKNKQYKYFAVQTIGNRVGFTQKHHHMHSTIGNWLLEISYAYCHIDIFQRARECFLSTWWPLSSLQFHNFLSLQLNSCNGPLNAIEKTLSVLWNAFNIDTSAN